MKNLKIETFPQVFKGDGMVAIIYRNHVEFYTLTNTDYTGGSDGANDLPFNPYSEIDMARRNGMRRIHCEKEIQVIRR